MINVNYGNRVSVETSLQIVNLLKGECITLDTGISEDIVLGMLKHPGEKVLNIVIGKSIEDASKCLPDNRNELIDEAAVLIKVSYDYRFMTTDLVTLIKYFDSYPMDPKITWRYALDSHQEEPVSIIILKTLK